MTGKSGNYFNLDVILLVFTSPRSERRGKRLGCEHKRHNMNEKNFWFPAKKYGWGWSFPCCWQGWAVLAVFFALLGAGAFLALHSITLYVIYSIILSLAFFLIVFIKGEKPRWRWGKD